MSYQSIGEAIHAAIQEVDQTIAELDEQQDDGYTWSKVYSWVKLKEIQEGLEALLVCELRKPIRLGGGAFEDMDFD